MNIFLSVWTKTRQATREMIDDRSVAFVIFLYALGSIGSMMMGLLDSQLDMPVMVLLLICLIAGPIAVILMQFIFVAVILLFSKLFKGTATYMELYKAAALGYIPFIVLIPFYTIWMATDIESLINTDLEPSGIIPIITIFLSIAMSIYSFIIYIVAVSEANRFSKWRAFFTLIIPGIILFIVILVIVFAILALVVGLTAL